MTTHRTCLVCTRKLFLPLVNYLLFYDSRKVSPIAYGTQGRLTNASIQHFHLIIVLQFEKDSAQSHRDCVKLFKQKASR